MRISFRVPGHVYDQNTELPVTDPDILAALDGWSYEEESMHNYLDMELADQGVAGGIIRVVWTAERGIEVVTDYWAPDDFVTESIKQLGDETRAQLCDGMGEGGFKVTQNGQRMLLVPDTEENPDVEMIYDGTPVLAPSRVARAARDGKIALLKDALASGEEIDGTLQGASGLHLAIIFGHAAAALLLISRGADVNMPLGDGGGETPLHLCALSNSLSDEQSAAVAEALLSHGADKSTVTSTGQTAALLAEARHKILLLTLLKVEEGK